MLKSYNHKKAGELLRQHEFLCGLEQEATTRERYGRTEPGCIWVVGSFRGLRVGPDAGTDHYVLSEMLRMSGRRRPEGTINVAPTGLALTLDEKEDAEAFDAVRAAIRRKIAQVRAQLLEMGVVVEDAPEIRLDVHGQVIEERPQDGANTIVHPDGSFTGERPLTMGGAARDGGY